MATDHTLVTQHKEHCRCCRPQECRGLPLDMVLVLEEGNTPSWKVPEIRIATSLQFWPCINCRKSKSIWSISRDRTFKQPWTCLRVGEKSWNVLRMRGTFPLGAHLHHREYSRVVSPRKPPNVSRSARLFRFPVVRPSTLFRLVGTQKKPLLQVNSSDINRPIPINNYIPSSQSWTPLRPWLVITKQGDDNYHFPLCIYPARTFWFFNLLQPLRRADNSSNIEKRGTGMLETSPGTHTHTFVCKLYVKRKHTTPKVKIYSNDWFCMHAFLRSQKRWEWVCPNSPSCSPITKQPHHTSIHLPLLMRTDQPTNSTHQADSGSNTTLAPSNPAINTEQRPRPPTRTNSGYSTLSHTTWRPLRSGSVFFFPSWVGRYVPSPTSSLLPCLGVFWAGLGVPVPWFCYLG